MVGKKLFGACKIFILVFILLFVLFYSAGDVNRTAGVRNMAAAPSQHAAAYLKLPLSFEPNLGQADRGVKFISRGMGYAVSLTEGEVILSLPKITGTDNPPLDGGRLEFQPRRHSQPQAATVLRMQFVGADPAGTVAGIGKLAGKSNYLLGSDPRQWRTGIANYARVQHRNVYPGIDVIYYGNQRQLEYDVVLSPGADPRRFRLRILGAEQIRISPQGDLVLTVPGGEIFQKRPFIYQMEGRSRRQIQGRYVMHAANEVGFSVASHDPHKPLVIDPVLTYATYLGGSAFDCARAIAVDSSGNIYIAGETESSDLPGGGYPPFQSALEGLTDAFVAKLNPAGTDLVYCTYLGGNYFENATAIAVDSDGSAYVAGYTSSNDFPVTPGAFDTTGPAFHIDFGFVSKLSSTGAGLEYSTFIGTGAGNNETRAKAIAVDAAGCAYVAGETGDFGLSTTPTAFQPDHAYRKDAFVIKFNAGGSGEIYGTFLGGHDNDGAYAIAVDSSGNAYIAGYTDSDDFPTLNAVQATRPNPGSYIRSGFVAALNSDASELLYSTYLGGASSTHANAIAVDLMQNAYVTGDIQTPSSGSDVFPLHKALQAEHGGDTDAFLTKFAPSGALVYSTYLGGSSEDVGQAVRVRAGSAYVGGRTQSFDFPAVNAFQPFLTGSDLPVFKSLDAGANWNSGSAGEGTGMVTALAVNPITSSILYVGSAVGRVFKSTDGGDHWNRGDAGLPEAEISSLAIAASNTNILYAGTKAGVYKSTDAGDTWFSRVTAGLDDLTVNAVAADPTNADIVYAAAGSGSAGEIYKSINGGASWTVAAWSDQLYITCLAIHPTTPQKVYSGTSNGFIVYSYDGFSTGPQVYNPSNDVSRINALAIDPTAERLYIAVDTFPITGYPELRLLKRTTDLQCVGSICAIYHYDGKGPGLSVAVSSTGNTYVGTPTTIEGVANTAGFSGPFRVLAADPSASNTVYMGNPGTNNDAFLSIVNPAGSTLLSSTFFGGSASDSGLALALGGSGKILLAGLASSSDLYTTPGTYQSTKSGFSDSFIAEFQRPARYLTSDFEGSGRNSIAVFRPAAGQWYSLSNESPDTYKAVAWGMESDIPVPADYTGDGMTDVAVWRPGSGVWYVLPSVPQGTFTSTQWGLATDIPVPGDYDGDGMSDIAVWRPQTGAWYVMPSSSSGTYTAAQWGLATDIPVPGDYDGDGKTDIAVWRPDNGAWYVLQSGNPGAYTANPWGMNADIPAPGDYDADGRTDMAVWRPGTGVWYILPSATPGAYMSRQWGLPSDTPVTGDYDGDGKTDIAVWRSGSGIWYILPSASPGSYSAIQWGMDGDETISGLTGLLRLIP